jgi:NAD(P)-dependent dehydrogenase (short-subunit alcohol dehydrogenase family)
VKSASQTMTPTSFVPFRLDGDVAIVTGAGSRLPGEIGNGRAISILLARQGAKVALLDIKAEWAEETKSIIEGEGGVAVVLECDVTVEESCKRAVERVVELWGGVRILVNNGKILFESFLANSLRKNSVMLLPDGCSGRRRTSWYRRRCGH